MLPRHAGLLSAVPTVDPPLPAARAGPQAGRMRADSGCSCPGILPDNFILELVDQHHQLGQLYPAPKGALAAARTLARSPSCHATLSTPPLSSLFMVRPCLLRCRWWPPRPPRRSATLVAGLGRGHGASSASAASAAAPHARFRAGWAPRMGSRGRAGTACRWLPWAVGRNFPVRPSRNIYVRRCYHPLNTSLRSVKLLLE